VRRRIARRRRIRSRLGRLWPWSLVFSAIAWLTSCARPDQKPASPPPERALGSNSASRDEAPGGASEPVPQTSGPVAGAEDVAASEPTPSDADEAAFAALRKRMVNEQLAARDITNPRVLGAMGSVPRHRFVPAGMQQLAYNDYPLPIGHDQTISQPYIVALMTQVVDPKPNAKALDIGTGSGYQAAVLAELVARVHSIEIVEPLARDAKARLATLGYKNVDVRHGDGYRGWPEAAPFDMIIVAAAPDHIPQPLLDQLAVGGKMVIPVGRYFQNLLLLEKTADGSINQTVVAPVAFVPMTGEAER
jgi:protein-L-isoaspartate(D-aspartate) O-methyltransferase